MSIVTFKRWIILCLFSFLAVVSKAETVGIIVTAVGLTNSSGVALPDNSLIQVIANTAGQAPGAPTVTSFVSGADIVLASFGLNSSSTGIPGSFQVYLTIDRTAFTGLNPGAPLLLRWYDMPYASGQTAPGFSAYGQYTTSVVIDDSSSGWTLGQDGSNSTLNFINAANGGSQPTTAGIAGNAVVRNLITLTAGSGQTKVYGASDPTFTYSITSGSLLGGDVITGVPARADGSAVGQYPITQGTLTAGDNYTITFVSTDFTITPKPITVTATTGQGKVSGETDPFPLAYTITSGALIGSDTLTGQLQRATGESAGSYPITQGTLTASSNYALTYNGANFTITPLTNVSRLSQTIAVSSITDRSASSGPVTLNATASSGLPVSFALISGPATLGGNTLTLTGEAGQVTIRASQAGNDDYDPAPAVDISFTVTLTNRLINLSSRGRVGTGAQTLITGFVIGGNEQTQVLIRGVGPGLAGSGVQGALANPRIRLFHDTEVIAENDDWSAGSNAVALAAAFSRVGAFPLAANSSDAALLVTLSPGAYTVHVLDASTDPTGGAGVALAEIYDASTNPSAANQRLVNISTRGEVGTGENILIAGFIIAGDSLKKVLIRGIGPSLASLGVGGTLSDPRLRIYKSTTLIAENDNWSDVSDADKATVAVAMSDAGAFALPVGSRDAALVLTLAPGAYTAQVSAADGKGTGVALVEIYEIP